MNVLRIYFTEFDEDKYRRVVEKLEEMGFKIAEHKSVVAPEFRYVEILGFEGEPERVREEIAPLIEASEYLKVDLVEVVEPKKRV